MAESEEADERCELCRLHPPEGLRKHGYTARHKKCVKDRFLPFLKKLDEVRKDLKKPSVVDGEIVCDSFWCHTCQSRVEKHITDGESSIVNGGTLAHIASEDHAERSKRFCQRQGIFLVEKDALKRLILDNSLLVSYLELVREATEKLQDDGARSKEAQHIIAQEQAQREVSKQPATVASGHSVPMPAQSVEQAVYRTVTNSFGILQNPTGWHDGQRVWGGGIVKYPPDSAQRLAWPIDHCHRTAAHNASSVASGRAPMSGQASERGDGDVWSVSGLNRIATPVVTGFKGNVHTDATAPWLLPDNVTDGSLQDGPSESIGPSFEDFQHHVNRQRCASKNPKRVGADHVKAMMRQSQGQGAASSGAAPSDPMWLPNFGRVYNYGARSDTKREFYKELGQGDTARRKRKHGS